MDPIDAVILAGGLGTRLQSIVGDRPKPMATVQGRPFLDILINDLLRQGLRRFILCVGHRREQIIAHYRSRTDADFVFSEEEVPLGTGGAVRHAARLIRSELFLVLNGDSLCRADYGRFLAFHREKGATLSIVAAAARGRTDGGSLELAADGRIVRFLEKPAVANAHRALINAGIYLLSRQLLSSWRQSTPFSLERDIFPELVARDRCYAFAVDAEVMDIGTPERYLEAQRKPPDPSMADTAPHARHGSSRVAVSVVIPCYRSSYIRRTLESVFSQTRLPEEIILVDDCSGDSTLETLRRIAGERADLPVKLIALERNLGQGAARNEGWQAATQPYIAFLDHDDSWHPRKLELQYEFMLQHPEAALSAHAWTRLHGAERIGTNEPAPGFAQVTKNQLLLSNRITCTTVMARRSLPCRFRAAQRYMEDHLLWLEMASDGLVLLKMNAILSYTFKAPFGESGVSSHLWRQEKAELENYLLLRGAGRIGSPATTALLALSVLKFVRRLLLVAVARLGFSVRPPAHPA